MKPASGLATGGVLIFVAPPVAGDILRLGSATLVVRVLRDGIITRVGLGLPK